jgi:hypothetical protein
MSAGTPARETVEAKSTAVEAGARCGSKGAARSATVPS